MNTYEVCAVSVVLSNHAKPAHPTAASAVIYVAGRAGPRDCSRVQLQVPHAPSSSTMSSTGSLAWLALAESGSPTHS